MRKTEAPISVCDEGALNYQVKLCHIIIDNAREITSVQSILRPRRGLSNIGKTSSRLGKVLALSQWIAILKDRLAPPDYAENHYLLFTFPWSHGLLSDLGWAVALGAQAGGLLRNRRAGLSRRVEDTSPEAAASAS